MALLRAQRLRPHGHIVGQTALSVVAFFAPVFAVLYWLTIPNGGWVPVLVAQLVVMLVVAVGLIGFLRISIWVDDTGISTRGLFGQHASFPIRQVGSIVVLDLYQSDATDTFPHLFVTGLDGRLLVRMRGQLYSTGAMDTVVDELGVPVVRVPEPMTLTELNRLRPELLYWFERRLTSRVPPPAEPETDLGP